VKHFGEFVALLNWNVKYDFNLNKFSLIENRINGLAQSNYR